jgi:hypothetical protein
MAIKLLTWGLTESTGDKAYRVCLSGVVNLVGRCWQDYSLDAMVSG